jgi:hypothetical protein
MKNLPFGLVFYSLSTAPAPQAPFDGTERKVNSPFALVATDTCSSGMLTVAPISVWLVLASITLPLKCWHQCKCRKLYKQKYKATKKSQFHNNNLKIQKILRHAAAFVKDNKDIMKLQEGHGQEPV